MYFKAITVALAIVFQLAVIGPASLIARNSDELMIRGQDLLGWPLVIGLMAAVLLTAAISLSLRRESYRIASVSAALGLYLYLQFYFLVPDLGIFDGRTANFEGHGFVIIFEIAILVGLLALAVTVPRRAFAVFAPVLGVLAIGEGVVVGTEAVLHRPAPPPALEATPADLVDSYFTRTSPTRTLGMPDLSHRNVIVILIDTIQGDMFANMLRNDTALAKAFDGFTVYENTTGLFPFTRFSIPAILTGTRYDGTETIPAYFERVGSRRLAARFDAAGYQVDLLPLGSRGPFIDMDREPCRQWATLYGLALMRQAPTVLKAWQYNGAKFRLAGLCGQTPTTRQELDPLTLNKLIGESRVTRLDQPSYKFMHFYGMHPPSRLTATCDVRPKTRTDTQAVLEQSQCVIRKVGEYLDKLRDLRVFQDSLVVVTADHGTLFGLGFEENISAPGVPAKVISSGNPALAFKDFGQKDPVQFSNAPASLLDVYPTVLESADIEVSDVPGYNLTDLKGVDRRLRDYLFYRSAREVNDVDYLKQPYWLANIGHVADPAAWGAYPSPKSGEAIRLVDPWLSSEATRIFADLTGSRQIVIEAGLSTPSPQQTVEVALNGRAVATWHVDDTVVDRSVTVDLQPDEAGAHGVVELRADVPSISADDRTDGVRVDWIKVRNLETQRTASFDQPDLPSEITIDFSQKGNADTYLVNGWGPVRSGTRATVAREATLLVDMDLMDGQDKLLNLIAVPTPGSDHQPVDVMVNGAKVAQWDVTRKKKGHEATIPASLVQNGALFVTFRLPETSRSKTADDGGEAVQRQGFAAKLLTIKDIGE